MTAHDFTAHCGHRGTSLIADPTPGRIRARRAYWKRTLCRACRGSDDVTEIEVTAQCGHAVTARLQPNKSEWPLPALLASARYYWRNHICPTCRTANDSL